MLYRTEESIAPAVPSTVGGKGEISPLQSEPTDINPRERRWTTTVSFSPNPLSQSRVLWSMVLNPLRGQVMQGLIIYIHEIALLEKEQIILLSNIVQFKMGRIENYLV